MHELHERLAALARSNCEIDQAPEKDQWSGPEGDREGASGIHPQFLMGCEQAPGQQIGGETARESEGQAEDEIALEGHKLHVS